MRIPHRRLFLSSLSALGGLATAAALSVLLPLGCNRDAASNTSGDLGLDGPLATLDARGSSVDSEVRQHQHAPIEGVGGPGGAINVTSSAGAVDISQAPNGFDADATVQAMTPLPGNSLLVRPGQTRYVAGGYAELLGLRIDSLEVQAGGTLVLEDNVFIDVTGDALIVGTVISRHSTGSGGQDGHDFILVAGGTVVVTGIINASGQSAGSRPTANQPPGSENPSEFATLGGNGGTVSITAGSDVLITGRIFAEGGGSDAIDSTNGAAGEGGAITIDAGGALNFAGQMSARAGNSFTNNVTPGPRGGSITLGSAGNAVLRDVHSINVSGGRNSGSLGGAGGTFDATAVASFSMGDNSVTGDPLVVDANGGAIFFENGAAGNGGVVTLGSTTSTAAFENLKVLANGGNVLDSADGPGGSAGAIVLEGTGITVASDVELDAVGGRSQSATDPGGAGGSLTINATSLTFGGTGRIRGGSNSGGQEGASGTVCVIEPAFTGMSASTRAVLSGLSGSVSVCE